MLAFLNEIGARESDTHEEKVRKYNLLIIAFSCCLIAPVWTWLSYLAGLRTASYMPLFFAPLLIIGIISLSVSKSDKFLFHSAL